MSMEQVRLVCQECGGEAYIWRKKGKLRGDGHVKHLWCYRCKDRTAHVEEKVEGDYAS